MPKSNELPQGSLPLSALDLQILLVLTRKDLYGCAIKKAVDEASEGVLSPEIGSLYRVLNRLMASGWVEEAGVATSTDGPQRGRPRRYYRITHGGTVVVRAELRRLRAVLGGAKGITPEAAR